MHSNIIIFNGKCLMHTVCLIWSSCMRTNTIWSYGQSSARMSVVSLSRDTLSNLAKDGCNLLWIIIETNTRVRSSLQFGSRVNKWIQINTTRCATTHTSTVLTYFRWRIATLSFCERANLSRHFWNVVERLVRRWQASETCSRVWCHSRDPCHWELESKHQHFTFGWDNKVIS